MKSSHIYRYISYQVPILVLFARGEAGGPPQEGHPRPRGEDGGRARRRALRPGRPELDGLCDHQAGKERELK